MAKIVFITPPQVFTVTQVAAVSVPPIGVGYLAAVAERAGHEVMVIDGLAENFEQVYTRGSFHLRGLKFEQIIERIPKDVDLIGISNLFSFAWPTVRELTDQIKKARPSVPMAVGGIHPTALPEFVLSASKIDFVIMGEGENILVNLIEALQGEKSFGEVDGLAYRENSTIKVNKRATPIEDLDSLPYPKYDALLMEKYIKAKEPHGAARGRWAPVIATRGCPYNCTFCTAPHMWEPVWRSRSPEHVIGEIEHLMENYGVTDIHFEDLTVAKEKKWMRTFCDEVKRRGLKFTWQIPNGTRIESLDREILALMKQTGCTNITFAPETGSKRILKVIDKSLDLSALEAVAKIAVEEGIVTCSFFIIGSPDETMEDIHDTFALIKRMARMGVDECTFSSFTLLPGCRLFFEFLQEGKVSLSDDYFLSLAYMGDLSKAYSWSKHLSDEKLTRLRRWAYFYFFFFSYLYHPDKAFKAIWNVLRDVQETKAQRVLREKLNLLLKRLTPAFTR